MFSQYGITSSDNGQTVVKVLRCGCTKPEPLPFCMISEGDTVFQGGRAVIITEGAHYSGDSSYDGYLAYGNYVDIPVEFGGGIFPEDCDKLEV